MLAGEELQVVKLRMPSSDTGILYDLPFTVLQNARTKAPVTWICKICGERMFSAALIRMHVLHHAVHAGPSEDLKVFSCSIPACEYYHYSFESVGARRKHHMHAHRKALHECKTCSFSHRLCNKVDKHIWETGHNDGHLKSRRPRRRNTAFSNTLHPEVKLLKPPHLPCNVRNKGAEESCMRSFRRPTDLSQHQRSAHAWMFQKTDDINMRVDQ